MLAPPPSMSTMRAQRAVDVHDLLHGVGVRKRQAACCQGGLGVGDRRAALLGPGRLGQGQARRRLTPMPELGV
jgi:hypothetical protein